MPNHTLREVLDLANNEDYPEEERLHEVVRALEGLLEVNVEQALALLRQVKANAPMGTFVVNEPLDLPDGYVQATEQLGPAGGGFTCGIAPDGSVSS